MIDPRFGFSRPIRAFRNTDLPVPEGPSRTLTSPCGTVRLTSSQIVEGPKDLVSPSTSIAIPMGNPFADVTPRHLPLAVARVTVAHRQARDRRCAQRLA